MCFFCQCFEYISGIYILLHIKKHYIIYFCYLFFKSFKVFSVSLSVNADKKIESIGSIIAHGYGTNKDLVSKKDETKYIYIINKKND